MASRLTISLDTETYGAFETDWDGHPLPPQQTLGKHDGLFHPTRCLLQHRPRTFCLLTGITVVNDPLSDEPWSARRFAALSPGPSMPFEMRSPTHLSWLAEWLSSADTILGQNLLYDLSVLRTYPQFRSLLDSRQTLMDMSVTNYLQCEVREAKSLKTVGPVLGTHSYDPSTSLRHFRFPSPTWKDPSTNRGAHEYVCEDTHNTVLSIAELARRILADHGPSTPKLSEWCTSHYTSVLWSCLRMVEAGIPLSRSILQSLLSQCQSTMARTSSDALTNHSLQINGEGSKASKDSFISTVVTAVNSFLPSPTSVLDHPLIKLTDKKKEVSWSDQNRTLFRILLPSDHPLQTPLSLIDDNSSAQKLIGSYITPLLSHKANDPTDTSSILLGDGDVGLAYSTIYIVPSQSHDTSSEGGGQQQVRLSFKKPAAQTFPKEIQSAYRSRFGLLGCIRRYDLSQAELRVAALLSGEPSLIDAFNRNLDLHAIRAATTLSLSNLPPSWDIDGTPGNKQFKKQYNTERQCFKHANFTDLNWGSALTLRRTILKKGGVLVPMDLCDLAVRTRERLRPVLFRWQNDWVSSVRLSHHAILPFTGQSRSFPGLLQGNDVNECVNFPIQAVAAMTMLRIQHFLHTHLPSINSFNPPCFMFLNCYDALYFDCLKSYVPTLDRLFASAVEWVCTSDYWHLMCSHYGHPVPLSYEPATIG